MELKRKTLIEQNEIDKYRYFNSLIETALRKEIVSDGYLDILQNELVNLLAKRCRKYTSGESSSVPIETAEALGHSVEYTLSIYLKTFTEPDDALLQLQHSGVADCYTEGLNRLKRLVKSTRLFYEQVKRTMIKTDNLVYNSTLIGGIAGFFKLYDIEFSAYDIHITADYPVMLYPQKAEGIEFIREYLNNIWLENKFCNYFNESDIKRVLSFHAVDYGDKVYDMMFNLYEVVLANAIACAIGGDNIMSLSPSENSKYTIKELFEKEKNGIYPVDLRIYANDVLNEVNADLNVSVYTLKICNELKNTVRFIVEN